ncbi:MAG TPA: hypothetical protein VNZ52_08445, partial [Candidatus Thermoplasmatota archaeon]|nr:hypothetical protein [Candidatus Thermoplasmatota archaeon]
MARETMQQLETVLSIDDMSDIQKRFLGADMLALLQIDVDALQIYNAVLQKIETDTVRTQIEEFAED